MGNAQDEIGIRNRIRLTFWERSLSPQLIFETLPDLHKKPRFLFYPSHYKLFQIVGRFKSSVRGRYLTLLKAQKFHGQSGIPFLQNCV
jgi:hypothetical protein